jgi:hypothetical protein
LFTRADKNARERELILLNRPLAKQSWTVRQLIISSNLSRFSSTRFCTNRIHSPETFCMPLVTMVLHVFLKASALRRIASLAARLAPSADPTPTPKFRSARKIGAQAGVAHHTDGREAFVLGFI